jgi:hypothetical protein
MKLSQKTKEIILSIAKRCVEKKVLEKYISDDCPAETSEEILMGYQRGQTPQTESDIISQFLTQGQNISDN